MPIRILVADDHQATRSAIATLVRNSGQDWEICGEAEDGQSAVEKAAELKPDILIMDLMMPQRDGISAGRAVRERVPSVSVLLYTLWVSEFLQAEARAAQRGQQAAGEVDAPAVNAIGERGPVGDGGDVAGKEGATDNARLGVTQTPKIAQLRQQRRVGREAQHRKYMGSDQDVSGVNRNAPAR